MPSVHGHKLSLYLGSLILEPGLLTHEHPAHSRSLGPTPAFLPLPASRSQCFPRGPVYCPSHYSSLWGWHPPVAPFWVHGMDFGVL